MVDSTSERRYGRARLLLSIIIFCLSLLGAVNLYVAGSSSWLSHQVAGLSEKFNAMMAFAFLALAVAFAGDGTRVERRKPGAGGLMRARPFWAFTLAIVPLVFALLTLAEHFFGADFRIDQLMWSDPDKYAVRPGRIGITAAIAIGLLALSIHLLCNPFKRFPGASQGFAVTSCFLVLFASVGHLFGPGAEAYLLGTTAIPASSVAVVLLLAGAIVCAQAQAGPIAFFLADAPGSKIARRLLLGAVAIVFAVGSMAIAIERLGWLTEGAVIIFFMSALMLLIFEWISTAGRQIEKANEAMRSTERLLQEVIDNAPCAVCVHDLFGDTVLDNKRYREITLEVGRMPIELEAAVITSIQANHEALSEEAIFADRAFLVNRFPIYDAKSRLVAIGAIATDITQQRRLSETLERKVSERTLQLLKANRELEAFNYSVSHDLRAPLRRVDGFSRLLSERYGDRLDETARSYLERIQVSSGHMGKLIEDLLMLSRISRGEVVREKVDVTGLAREVVDEKIKSEPDRPMRVEIQSGMTVEADSGLLKIVLTNLIENAWKFTSKKTLGAIEISCAKRADGRRWFLVRDNGAGFDMSCADQLFKAFQRLHSQDEFPGTGVGLVTVQRVVEEHGGEIEVSAMPDKGACFQFTLEPLEENKLRRTEREKTS